MQINAEDTAAGGVGIVALEKGWRVVISIKNQSQVPAHIAAWLSKRLDASFI